MAERQPTLYDHTGRPVNLGALRRDTVRGTRRRGQQGPQIYSLRGQWYESLYRLINPTSLAWILYESRQGYTLDRFLTLAEELEEADTHYSGVLRARKRATTKLPLVVEPNGAQANVAAAVEKLIEEPFVREALQDMLDGLGKGFSCTEIVWQSSASGWEPRELKWRDPRFFAFSPSDRTTILMRVDTTQYQPLPPFKFLYHEPKLKSGLPIRNGLARLCAWVWLYKHFSIRDWMSFLEVYGQPVRVGKYGASATEENIAILTDQVHNLGHDAAAVIPEGMDIEFVQVANAGGQGAVFEKAARYFDQALSKAVIGQTMTTESGGSLAQAKVHVQVAHDLTEGDAAELAMTLSRQLVMPFVQLNFGMQERYPLVRFEIPQRPGENSEGSGEGGGNNGGGGDNGPASGGENNTAANAIETDPADELEELAAEYLGSWRSQMAPIREDLEALLRDAGSLEEARDRLPDLLATWGERDARFIDAIGESGFKAAGMGNSE